MMTLQDRAESYARAFPQWPGSWPTVSTTGVRPCLRGEWMFGQDYRNKSKFYGAYPGNYLERLAALFPDRDLLPGAPLLTTETRTLHAFSGSLPPGPYDRCDMIQPAEYQCDVATLAEAIGDHDGDQVDAVRMRLLASNGGYDLVCADPPYTADDAMRYGSPPPNRAKATRALAKVTRVGGHLAWLDTCWPMHSKREWITVGRIYVARSTNHRVRLLTIFERVQ